MQQVGRYQLIRKLATGGMAEVFLAKAAGPMGFEKTLVLKRILPHLAEDPAFVEMFLSEAKLAARLTHPHIVQIFDFGEADGVYFLVMEYIDGPNLRTLVKRASAQGMSLPMVACARLIAHACEGLAFAHDFTDPETGAALGLIHRDISADNILLSKQGAVKVVDFGIAKAAGQIHKTQSGVIKGKLSYMPPEQVRAESLDRRADVYALGVVLYELLTAHKPFKSESDVGLMQAILTQSPTPAAQFRPELPDSLLSILGRVLSRDREQRYPDCHAFQSDLEDFIRSESRPVTTQHIAQLIAQVVSGTGQPMPMPQPGIPPGGPQLPVTPVHGPAPTGTKTAVDAVPVSETVEVRGSQEPTQVAHEARSDLATVLALVGVVLLALGVGFLLWRTAFSASEPQHRPLVAQHRPLVAQREPSPSTPPPSSAPAAPSADSSGVRPQDVPPPPKESDTSKRVPPSLASVPAKPKRSPPASPKSVLKGTLEFRVRPYATVFLNGRELGDTPVPLAELPAGTYTVKLVNKSLSKTVTRSVEVTPGKLTVFKFNFLEE
jgi:serine/threonine protein kinase